jgi:hypothetical protein
MRRNVLTILGITALVITLVVVLGPSMTEISTSTPTRANSIPIKSPESNWNTDSDLKPAIPPQLAFEVRDAVTGARIERDAAVTLTLEDGTLVDVERGHASGEAVAFEGLPDKPLFARVRLPGYLDTEAGPLTVEPGPKTVRLLLTPMFVVSVRPRLPSGKLPDAVRVFSTTPPTWPRRTAYAEWRTLDASGATYTLPPGKYWCQVPELNPMRHADFPDRSNWLDDDWLTNSPGFVVRGRSFVFEFEVVDRALVLEPEVTWPEGKMSIAGRLVDQEDRPLGEVFVCAIRTGPGPLREQGAIARTDDNGKFLLEGLMPGFYRVRRVADSDGDGPGGIWVGELQAGVAVDAIRLVAESRPDNESTEKTGSVEVRILRRGKPVKGARLKLEGWGTLATGYWNDFDRGPEVFAGETDDDGRLLLKDRQARNYVVRPISPLTMQMFDLQIWPDMTTKVEWEITPPGTADFHGFVRHQGAETLWYVLDAKDEFFRKHLFWNPEKDESFEVCGIPPGAYVFKAPDTDWFDYAYDVTFKSDEALVFERNEGAATVSGPTPYAGFWKSGASIEFWELGEVVGSRARSWDHSLHPPLQWEETIDIKRVPKRAFRLAAKTASNRVVAVAEVDTTNGNVEDIQWTLLYDQRGGTLKLECPMPSADKRTGVEIYLARDDVAELQVERLWMAYVNDKRFAMFEGVPAGEWIVTITGSGIERWSQTVKVENGVTQVLTLVPLARTEESSNPNKEGAKDRPIGGVTIKLPTPSSTVGPPGEPPPPPPEQKVLPPLPPVPYNPASLPAGREVYLFCSGATHDELWSVFVHGGSPQRPLALGVAERSTYLAVDLVLDNSQPVIVISGLEVGDATLILQLPGRKNVTVALKADVASYIAEFTPE